MARQPPAQLPPDVHGFAGRDDELRRLDSLVAEEERPTEVVISAVSGTAGVGKTALAVHWAHSIRDRFPDGQLYVNLRGFEPSGQPMSPFAAVRGFLHAYGVSPDRLPADADAQASLYRSVLTGKRVLVVLDNARDADQIRPLLPGSPGCLVLVTSRNDLASLTVTDGAQPVALDLLTTAEARELLARRLGRHRVAAESRAVDDIIASCARLPLALAIVAARSVSHPSYSLGALAAELRDSRARLDALTFTDASTDVRTVLSWSYRQLSPEAARLFRLLGLHPGPDISVPAAASLAGIPPRQVRPLLAELTHAHLISERAPARFTFHDLLRTYATELAHTDTEHQPARLRMLHHYLHTAHTAAMLLATQRDRITLSPAQPGTALEDLADHRHALAWFTTEHAILLAVLEQAAGNGSDTLAWQLAWTLTDYFDRQGHWHDWATAQRTALAATRRQGDKSGQAYAHRCLARADARLGRYREAHLNLQRALDLYDELGDQIGRAHAHRSFGWVHGLQGNYAEALLHTEQALDSYWNAGNRYGQASTLNSVGWFHGQLGRYQKALTCCEQALELLQQLGDRFGEADTSDSLGYAHHHLGHHRQAIGCYEQALDLYHDLGERYSQANTLIRLGDTHHATGDAGSAGRSWQQALAILQELDHPDADIALAKLHHLGAPHPRTSGIASLRRAGHDQIGKES